MRYEVRRNNQVLHVFDTEQYTAAIAFPVNQRAEATKHANLLNVREVIGEHREVLQALTDR